MTGGADRDLLRLFWDGASSKVGEATDLWLKIESGDKTAEPTLKRLLHTLKGEAHMLGLPTCGRLMQTMEEIVQIGPTAEGAGDAMLNALDVLAAMSTSDDGEQAVDAEPIIAALRTVVASSEANGGEADEALSAPAGATKSARPGAPAAREERISQRPQARAVVEPSQMQPMIAEALRLHLETGTLQPKLREIRRMFRALLAEIDPHLTPAQLAEQIVKTLGYGAEIERRLGQLNAQWSATEFELGRALEQIDDVVRAAAVVSVGGLHSQVHRAARSAAQMLGKKIEVRFTGDAYVDASVERLLAPALLHLVRNAVDHGIEAPEVRRAHGKPEMGRIDVVVKQTDSSATVGVQDDGGGIDVARLRAKFSDERDDDTVLQRIFEHGVSTRDEVTELSGRGVGLDVVARSVASVGGTVRVSTTRGAGTRFEIVLPTSLRAELVVPFSCKSTRLGLPVRVVVAVERIQKIVRTADGLRIARGAEGKAELLPLHDVAALFEQQESPREGEPVIVIQHRSGTFALRVDSYDNPRALSFERIGELAIPSDVVRGVAAAPDGSVYYLVDSDALFVKLRGGTVRRAAIDAPRAQAHVLVVEDAPVARELLLGILRAFGLRVSDAADGREGLQRARADRPDLILTDVEMPFLNGLDMVQELRADATLHDVPVIVLTTRTDQPMRDRARSLGVRGYLSKQRFVETELREMIDACLAR